MDLPANNITLTFFAALLFDSALSSPLKETLFQLLALSRDGVVGPITLADLAHRTGKSIRTLSEHLRILHTYQRAVTVYSEPSRKSVIRLPDWLLKPVETGSSTSSPDTILPSALINKEEDVNLLNPVNIPPLTSGSSASNCRGALSPSLARDLANAGIFQSLFAEIEADGCTEDYLTALLAWCRHDYPERPGGLFMYRLRKRLAVPASYYRPPCTACGERGAHAPGCRVGLALSWGVGAEEDPDES